MIHSSPLKGDGTAIETFDGDTLIQQEPDASSFPNGGLRATFRGARLYCMGSFFPGIHHGYR